MTAKIRVPSYLGETDSGAKIELHKDAVTQGFAFLGKRGKGKSTLAADMFETFAARGDSFVILDPPEAHWGIRFKTNKDGAPIGPSGFRILLIGGEHGDIPLDPTGGKEHARIIVDGDISAVISMKQMGFTERQRYCADFGEELFRLNKTPRHIGFEETQNFIPQQLKFEEQKRVLYAMEKIVEEGRGAGLGFSLISQRPALINKNVLEQVDNMFAMGMIGPNDLAQMRGWFEHHVGDKQKLKEIIDDLAKMKQGECWFLSPEWMDEMVKFHARQRVTYHAGRTPKTGEKAVNVNKFTIDEAVQRLKILFESKREARAIEVADLKEAKKEIKRLVQEVKNAKSAKRNDDVVHKPKSVIEPPKVTQAEIRKVVQAELKPWKDYASEIRDLAQRIARTEEPTIAPPISSIRTQLQSQRAHFLYRQENKPAALSKPRQNPVVRMHDSNESSAPLVAGAMRLLAAVAGWPNGMTEGQMRAHAGLRNSGTYSTYMSRLRTNGLIELRNGLVVATEKGVEMAGTAVDDAPQNTEGVLRIWGPKLGQGPMRILNALLEENPLTVSNLREKSGFSENSGTFSTYLSRLRTARLITVERGVARPDSETLLLA